jgi:hypothetical protein
VVGAGERPEKEVVSASNGSSPGEDAVEEGRRDETIVQPRIEAQTNEGGKINANTQINLSYPDQWIAGFSRETA